MKTWKHFTYTVCIVSSCYESSLQAKIWKGVASEIQKYQLQVPEVERVSLVNGYRSKWHYQKLLKHVLNYLNGNAKGCAGDANVLIQNYLAQSYANIHVTNNYMIKMMVSYFEELFLNFCFMGLIRKLFHLIFIRYCFYYLCLVLWQGFSKGFIILWYNFSVLALACVFKLPVDIFNEQIYFIILPE